MAGVSVGLIEIEGAFVSVGTSDGAVEKEGAFDCDGC